jgi:hypothetical protein
MRYSELVEKRRSVRRFSDKEVSKEQIAEIEAYFPTVKPLIPGIEVEMGIFTGNSKNRLEGVAGYKGYALGAPAYLVILSDKKDYYLENAGFIGEDLVLKLTDMGLGTCWISVGDSHDVKRALLLNTDKEVAGIVACGYAEREIRSRRLNIKSPSNVTLQEEKSGVPKLSQHDLVYYESWGRPVDWDSGVIDPYLDEALYAASLAPTYLNKQPDRFILSGKKLLLCEYKDADQPEAELGIDMGAVMKNFCAVYYESINSKSEWKMIQGSDSSPDYIIVASFEI